MGSMGSNTVSFLKKFKHEIAGEKLTSLRVEYWTPLWCLRDLRRNIPEEVTLAEKIIVRWSQKTQEG